MICLRPNSHVNSKTEIPVQWQRFLITSWQPSSATLKQTRKTTVRSVTQLKESHPSSSHLSLAGALSAEGMSCEEMREGMYSSASLPSGGVSQSLFPQSSLWLCACCSLEEGSWITLRILLKSYLRLCLNRRGETFHKAQPWRSVKQHSDNQQPLVSKQQKNEEIWSLSSTLCTLFLSGDWSAQNTFFFLTLSTLNILLQVKAIHWKTYLNWGNNNFNKLF